jgi:hypothetical protein
MKKILVTGSKFTGSVTLIYGEAESMQETQAPLLKVELDGAALTDHQKVFVLNCVPVRYGAGYEQNWGAMTGKVQIVAEDYEVSFEDFWDGYGEKLNRGRCEKIWKKMSGANKALAVVKIGAYMRYLSKRQWQTKMGADTWLNNRRYADDWDNSA